MPTLKNSSLAIILLLTLLFAMIWGGDYLQVAPQAKTTEAAKEEFSAQRAQIYVKTIALKPHPAGSIANAVVRDYLVKTLQDLGADVEVQQRIQKYDYLSQKGQARFGNVENVVARFPGRESGAAILLMAHYDSRPNTPGAGDNASGVAATLETLRALTTVGLPMKNTLIVLFSDAEEAGLLGSQAFFNHHRWADQIKLALNFDSRGSSGPVFMYQTSKNGGSLVDIMAQVVPPAMGNSLVHSIFNKMPSYSDLAIAFKSGIAGMNFAFINGLSDYHAATDTVNNLSLDSLQHMGDFELPLIRHFGEIELPVAQSGERHYFNFLGDNLIRYSPWFDWGLWLVSAGLLIMMSIRAIKLKTFTLLQLFQGIGCALLFITLPAYFVLVIDRVIDQSVHSTEVLARQKSWFIVWGLLASGITVWLRGAAKMSFTWLTALIITFTLVLFVLAGGLNYSLVIAAVVLGSSIFFFGRPLNTEASFTGGLWLLLLLATVALWQLAGGAYVLTCSLLPIVIVQLLRCYKEDKADKANKPNKQISLFTLSLFAGVPLAIILGGTALTFDQMVGYDLPVISVLPLLVLSLFFSPILEVKYARNTGSVIVAFCLIALTWLTLSSPWSERHPQAVSQFVLYDVNNDSTYWASEDRSLTHWHRISLGSHPKHVSSSLYQPDSHKSFWLTPVENVNVLSSKLELISFDEQQRQVNLRIKPAYGGDTITLFLDPCTELLSWTVNGQPLSLVDESFQGWYALTGFAIPEGGVEITLKIGQRSNLTEFVLKSIHNALPNGLAIPLRNAQQMRGSTQSNSDSTVTFERIALSNLINSQRG